MTDEVKKPVEFDDEHIEEFRAAFSLFDKDGDGTVSASELQTVLKAMGKRVTRYEVDQMLEKVDKDGNGLLDFDEFLQLMALQVVEPAKADDYTSAFKVFDHQHNGTASAHEVTNVISLLKSEHSDEVNDVLKSFMDSNGRINYIEMV